MKVTCQDITCTCHVCVTTLANYANEFLSIEYRTSSNELSTCTQTNTQFLKAYFTMHIEKVNANTVCPNKKETRFVNEISSLPRKF